MRDSVTVSIAELTRGTRSVMSLVTRDDVSTSLGITSDAAGNNRTSSNVSPSIATLPGSSPPVRTCVIRPFYLVMEARLFRPQRSAAG